MKQPKETFEHMVTVLSILFGDAREANLVITKTDKEWEKQRKKEKKLYKQASNYLKRWIGENYS